MTNKTSSNKLKNKVSKKISAFVRWVVGGFFIIFAVANGFHYSRIFLICAAILMLPLPFVCNGLNKLNIKAPLVIVLAIVLFLVGAIISPVQSDDSVSDDAPQATTESDSTDTTSINDNTSSETNEPEITAKPETNEPEITVKPETNEPEITAKPETNEPETTTADDDDVEMVWVSSKGKKYHSKSTCSNMSSPYQISIEKAIKQGYTACKKCH